MSLSVRSVFILLCMLGVSARCSAQIDLGEAKAYGILGRLSVTNTGPTVINGDLGTGGTSVTGFYPPGIVNGNIVIGDATGAAFLDATAAYTNITAAIPAVDLTGSDLGGMNLRPGTYAFSSTAQLTGALTLNGTGSPNDEWYFQIGKALTTASASAVVFVNGGNACRVYWAVGSAATLGTGTSFAGSIIAGASVTFDTGASLIGRAFGMSATVTLDSNLVTVPDCSVSSSSSSIVQGSSTPPAVNPPTPSVPPSGSTTQRLSVPAELNPTLSGRLSISTSIFLPRISAAVSGPISNVPQPSTASVRSSQSASHTRSSASPPRSTSTTRTSSSTLRSSSSLSRTSSSTSSVPGTLSTSSSRSSLSTTSRLTSTSLPNDIGPGPDPQGSATGGVLTFVFPPFPTIPGPGPQGSATGDVHTIVLPPFPTGPDELPYSEFASESTVSSVESTTVTYPARSTISSNTTSSASDVSQTIITGYSTGYSISSASSSEAIITVIVTTISTLTSCPHKASCTGQTSTWTGSECPLPCSVHTTCTCVLPAGVPTKDVIITVISTLTTCPHKETCTGQTSTWTSTQGPFPCSASSTCSCVLPGGTQTVTSCPTSAICTGQRTQWTGSQGPRTCAAGVTCNWILPSISKSFSLDLNEQLSRGVTRYTGSASTPAQTAAAAPNQGDVIPPGKSASVNNTLAPNVTGPPTSSTAVAGNSKSICSFLIYGIVAAVLALI